MKKKLLTLLFMICLVIPCSFLFVSCGNKEPESLTVSFSLNTDTLIAGVTYDEDEKTISWTYNKDFNFSELNFNIVGTNAEGKTQNIPKATETTVGYKIETDLPANRTNVPAGSYTFKLYCEATDNEEVKYDACETTWTIEVEKKTIDCAEYEWTHRTTHELVYTPGLTFEVFLDSTSPTGLPFSSVEGVSNFKFDQTSHLSGSNAGTYTTRVDFNLDTNNYNHINLPEKTYTWAIAKADPKDYLSFEEFWGSIVNGYTIEYNPDDAVSISSQKDTNWRHLAGFGFTGNFEGTSSTTEPGTYTVRPIFTEQTDTSNWLEYDPEYYELTWSVVPKLLDLSNIEWNYSEPFEYDESITREVSLSNLPVGISVAYTNNSAQNAGTYEATAVLSFDSKYYTVPEGTNLTYTLTWVIVADGE